MVDKNKVITLTSTFTKSVLPTKDISIDSIMIEGYASTVDTDRQGDIVPSTVWKSGVQNYLKNPVILAYHDHSEPIGRMVDHRIDSKGLWIKARISAAAGEVFNLIKDGVLTAFSIGFRIADAEYNAANELFVVKELELHEISVVSVPANQNTLFSLSKSFKTDEELKFFKLQFAPKLESAKGLESPVEANSDTTKEWNMDPKDLEKLLADTAKQAAAETAKAIAEQHAQAAVEKAAQDRAQADLDAKIKAAVAQVQTVDTGAERLLAEVEKRVAEQEQSHKSALASLQATLAEKAAELEAVQKSRMQFAADGTSATMSYADKEKAVLLARMANKGVEDTKFGREMVQKYGAHVPSATWELEVSLNMEAEVRRRLVVAPLFRQIAMQTNVMRIPVNPEAGTATWVDNANFGAVPGSLGAAGASAGNTATHALKEITLSAYKVATNEYTAYEEEEDSLIAIMPVIRDGMIRRIARAVDKALLRGAEGTGDPIKGLASAAGASTQTGITNTTTAVTVANLRNMRKQLGVWGLDPADVVYIVNSSVYYNLLEDTVFQTMNQVGPQATLLTGQIGQIGNSPVLVSGELNDPSATAGSTFANVGAICVAPGNFVVGNQRGLRIDTQELVETQRRVMVASLRTGFVQVTSNYGAGVTRLIYSA
jgi:HK97 family phage prohead protease/HK97 family phage major capsid protein